MTSENAALADEHGDRATTAENAASHQVRLGGNGEIVHERYGYDALGRLTSRQDHAVDLTAQDMGSCVEMGLGHVRRQAAS